MRNIKKERIVLVFPDKINGLLRIPRRQHRLIFFTHPLDLQLSVLKILQRKLFPSVRVSGMVLPHVIRIKQTARLVESPVPRPSAVLIADMPLAEQCGLIAVSSEHLRHYRILRIEPGTSRPVSAKHFRPARITTAQQRRPRCRTYCLRNIKVIEPPPLCRKLFNMRRLILRFTERRKITPPGIIQKDYHDIRFSSFT